MNGTVQFPGTQTGPDAPVKPATPAAVDPQRPAWLPEKFKTPEDLVKSYGELESKLGSKPAPTPTPTPAPAAAKPGVNPLEVPPPSAEPAAPAKLADLSEYEKEYAANSKISDESYAKLEAAGYTRTVIDNYIAGQVARAQQMQSEVFQSVGGQENYSRLMAWAAKGLNPAETAAYNKAVAGGTDAAKLAAAGLMNRYQQAYGKDPNLSGGRSAPSGPAPYSSWAEVTRDMGTREYKESPAFRETVQNRLAASKI